MLNSTTTNGGKEHTRARATRSVLLTQERPNSEHWHFATHETVEIFGSV